MKGAALVVANDTGPGHMAGAVGIPVFSILGPTIAARWGPYGRNVRVLQHADPEAEDAVDAWPSVDEVLRAAAEVLTQD
jgi:ADP-heptose:LPS heptosyltransferase